MITAVPYVDPRSRRDRMLAGWGVLDEVFDPMQQTGGTALSTGRIYTGLIGLNAGDVVGNIVTGTVTAAAGTAPTLVKFGLADSAGVILAVTADVKADAQLAVATAYAKFPLASSYTVTSGGAYQVIMLVVGTWGTTQLTVSSKTASGAGTSAIGAGPKRFGNTAATQTDLVVSATLPATTAVGVFYYLAAAV